MAGMGVRLLKEIGKSGETKIVFVETMINSGCASLNVSYWDSNIPLTSDMINYVGPYGKDLRGHAPYLVSCHWQGLLPSKVAQQALSRLPRRCLLCRLHFIYLQLIYLYPTRC